MSVRRQRLAIRAVLKTLVGLRPRPNIQSTSLSLQCFSSVDASGKARRTAILCVRADFTSLIGGMAGGGLGLGCVSYWVLMVYIAREGPREIFKAFLGSV